MTQSIQRLARSLNLGACSSPMSVSLWDAMQPRTTLTIRSRHYTQANRSSEQSMTESTSHLPRECEKKPSRALNGVENTIAAGLRLALLGLATCPTAKRSVQIPSGVWSPTLLVTKLTSRAKDGSQVKRVSRQRVGSHGLFGAVMRVVLGQQR